MIDVETIKFGQLLFDTIERDPEVGQAVVVYLKERVAAVNEAQIARATEYLQERLEFIILKNRVILIREQIPEETL